MPGTGKAREIVLSLKPPRCIQENAAVVAAGSSAYDIFPSLHTYITLVLLEHDRREHPRRFRVLLPVAVAILLSTLVLRYHYAVDLVAGALWFVAFLALQRQASGVRAIPALSRADWTSWTDRRAEGPRKRSPGSAR